MGGAPAHTLHFVPSVASVPMTLVHPVRVGYCIDSFDIGGTELNAVRTVEALDRQLGLKLELRKHPMPVLVIDHVELMPTEN